MVFIQFNNNDYENYFLIHQRNRLLILPWLINSTISLLFALVWMILASVYISQNFNDYSTFIPIIVMAFIVYGE